MKKILITITMLIATTLYANLIAIKNDEGVEFVRVSEINEIIKTDSNIAYPIEYGLYSQFKDNPKYLTVINKVLLEKSSEEKAVMDLPSTDRRIINGVWQECPTVTNTIEITNAIPLHIVDLGNKYKDLITQYFGNGAETNRSITENVVAFYFATLTNATWEITRDGSLLNVRFNILRQTGLTQAPDEVWTFPYGQTEIITIITNIIHVCD